MGIQGDVVGWPTTGSSISISILIIGKARLAQLPANQGVLGCPKGQVT